MDEIDDEAKKIDEVEGDDILDADKDEEIMEDDLGEDSDPDLA